MNFWKRNGAWIGFFLLVVAITVLTNLLTDGNFLAPRNLTNLLKQASINGILAAGMTAVVLTGGIDLSIGSIVALAGVVVGISQVHWGWAELGAMGALYSSLLALAVGAFVGLANGGLIASLGIPPFIITLGLMIIARGIALILTDGNGIAPMGDALQSLGESYFGVAVTSLAAVTLLGLVAARAWRRFTVDLAFPLGAGALFFWAFLAYRGLPVLGLFLGISLAVSAFVLSHTVLGRSVYALGSNPHAAFWAGVPVRKVKVFVYGAMGLLSGLSGLLLTARLNGAVPTAGQLFELDAIAAVVIGGTSLKGGSGTILGSFVGALIVATLNNGMDLLGVPSFYQMVCKGAIIIVAVALDSSQRQD